MGDHLHYEDQWRSMNLLRGRMGHNKSMTPDIYPMSAMFGLKPCSSLSYLTLSNPLVAQTVKHLPTM